TKYTLSSNVPSPEGDTSKTNIYFNGSGTSQSGVWINNANTQISDENGELYVAIPTGRPYTEDLINGVYWIQLEKGNKATDWTPAPEDTDAKIEHIETEWTQTFDSFSQTVASIDGRVTSQKQTIDGITSTVSGHGGRLSTVEQTASGLQTTVASKASQTQVTQLATGFNVLVTGLKDNKNMIPYWEVGGLVERNGEDYNVTDRIRTPMIKK